MSVARRASCAHANAQLQNPAPYSPPAPCPRLPLHRSAARWRASSASPARLASPPTSRPRRLSSSSSRRAACWRQRATPCPLLTSCLWEWVSRFTTSRRCCLRPRRWCTPWGCTCPTTRCGRRRRQGEGGGGGRGWARRLCPGPGSSGAARACLFCVERPPGPHPTLLPGRLPDPTHPTGKVTVSTVGLVDKLEEFVERCSTAQLAVSLHATTDEARRPGFGAGGAARQPQRRSCYPGLASLHPATRTSPAAAVKPASRAPPPPR
jgi:hypothetical protein